MVISLIKNTPQFYFKLLAIFTQNRLKTSFVLLTILIVFGIFQPQKLADIWLTRDQQGQILFNMQRYEQAAITFSNTRWQAYSFYGAEKFKQSATLYDQFTSSKDVLARANALAHDRRYIKARDIYQLIVNKEPDNEKALNNLKIVQAIIDQVNMFSESQKAEDGDAPKELGDEPQTGDGADKKELRKQAVEQLSAEQLLLDPKLNEMWLRQVQKDPARFLSQKFYMQNINSAKAKAPIDIDAEGEVNE